MAFATYREGDEYDGRERAVATTREEGNQYMRAREKLYMTGKGKITDDPAKGAYVFKAKGGEITRPEVDEHPELAQFDADRPRRKKVSKRTTKEDTPDENKEG